MASTKANVTKIMDGCQTILTYYFKLFTFNFSKVLIAIWHYSKIILIATKFILFCDSLNWYLFTFMFLWRTTYCLWWYLSRIIALRITWQHEFFKTQCFFQSIYNRQNCGLWWGSNPNLYHQFDVSNLPDWRTFIGGW